MVLLLVVDWCLVFCILFVGLLFVRVVLLGRLLGRWFGGGVLCMFWRVTLVLFRLLLVVL